MIERVWTATVSWGSDGRDLDIFSTVTAGGQTSSGVGWNNGRETTKVVVQNNQVNGTFYAIWGGDNTSFAGSETVTIYFRGERLPTGNVENAPEFLRRRIVARYYDGRQSGRELYGVREYAVQ